MSGIQLKSLKKRSYYLPDQVNSGQSNPAYQFDEQSELPVHVNGNNAPTKINGPIADKEAESLKEASTNITNDSEEIQSNCCIAKIRQTQSGLNVFLTEHSTAIKRLILAILAVAYAVYFAFALNHRFGDEGSIRLLWITCLVCVLLLIGLIKKHFGSTIENKIIEPPKRIIKERWSCLRWLVFPLVIIGFTLFIILDIAMKKPSNLVSISGLVIFISVFFIFSNNPTKVRWRPVLWGIAIQFILGLIVLRTSWGRTAFSWLGNRVKEFLEHTNAGSSFVFGPKYTDHPFAMKVMPIVIFFSTVISVLYYLGVMQFVISKIAWVMRVTMGTTAGESMNAAGNIFLGLTEAPLLIRPLLPKMTRSELHAVMVGGFASIAGSVMATFIAMGVPANDLITACVMAAPAALAMSKLSYPEEEVSRTTLDDVKNMERPPYRNVVEAASAGATAAVKLVANILANLIAFIAILTFVNATLSWFGARVGLEPPNYPPLTFQLICSYVLWPISLVMGVVVRDCRKVAELIGTKIFLNEFVAYTELSKIINNRKEFDAYQGNYTELNNGDIYLTGTNTTLIGGIMYDRSISIATYALCGFANISSIGVTLGALGGMAPERKGEMSSFAIRTMLTGATASLMTACIAGLLYQGN